MNQVVVDIPDGRHRALYAAARHRHRPDILLRSATTHDALPVSVLQSTAFDGPAEARMTMSLRRRGALIGEVLAVAGGRVVGHAALAALTAPSGWAVLLPVAVLPDAGDDDLGLWLAASALERAAEDGVAVAVTTGDPDVGRRLGFRYDRACTMCSPYPRRFTGLLRFDSAAPPATMPQALLFPAEMLDA